MSDINIGQIAEALNDKTDRDLMNVDTGVGADAVIEYQMPTAENNYTWYRKYKSGWVEQGGCYDNGSASTDFSTTITLPIQMANGNYTAVAIAARNTGSITYRAGYTNIFTQSTTQLGIGWYRGGGSETMQYINWTISCMAAN